MSPKIIALIFIVTASSSFIHSVMGFGYSLFAMSLMPMFLPVHISSAIVNFALLILCTQITVQLRNHINWRLAIPPTIFALIGKPLGVMLLVYLPNIILKRILGAFLIALAIYFLLNKDINLKPTLGISIAFGLAAGLLGGLFNLAGTVTAIYFYNCCDDKYEYSASMNFTFVPAALVGLAMHYHYGFLSKPIINSMLLNIVAVGFAAYMGMKVFRKINRDKLGKALYIYIALSGISMVFSQV